MRLLSLTVSLLLLALPAAAETSLAGPDLVAALRQGGYVLVMRHALSPREAPATPSADNVKGERELDENGKRTAAAMGEALRTLKIPLGPVLSSPTYRAQQTARVAGFPKPAIEEQLGDGGQGMAADAEGKRSEWLRAKVTQTPPAGSNLLLVTHFPNIQGAFGDLAKDVADGETLVFRPGTKDPVARVKIGQWSHLEHSP